MFYLGIQNQVSLLVVVCFGFYMTLNSFIYPEQDRFSKQLSLAFMSPLIISIASFLTLRYDRAALLLLLSEVSLVFAVFLCLLVKKSGSSAEFLNVILFLLPFAVVIFGYSVYLTQSSPIFFIVSAIMLAISCTIFLSDILLKKNHFVLLYAAICIILTPILIKNIPSFKIPYVLEIVLKITGFSLIVFFYHQNTLGLLYKKYIDMSYQLRRIDSSIQREISRRVEEIEKSNKRLVEIAKKDKMTDTYTKQAIIDSIDQLIQRFPKKSFSIIMFDIDEFKKINDNLGHLTGDKCIKRLVHIAKRSLRNEDKLGRYGGDEFIILLPDTGILAAHAVAERFRRNVEKTESPHFTVSVGIASYPKDGKSAKTLIASADKALYMSKESGRNRVSLLPDDDV